MSLSTCQCILVRNLPHDVSELEFLTYLSQRKSCASLFESDTAPQAVLSSFKPGKAPNALKGRAAVSATAFLMVESPNHAQLIAAALDSIAFRPTSDPQLLMTVEYSPSQEPPTPGTATAAQTGGVGALAAGAVSIFADTDFADFLVKHNLVVSSSNAGADATKVVGDKEAAALPPPAAAAAAGLGMSKGHTTAALEKWLEEQKVEADSRRSTALVQAMLGKWYRNIPFSWEQRRGGGGKGGDQHNSTSTPAATRAHEKKKERKKGSGEAAASAAVQKAASSVSSKTKSRTEAIGGKKGAGKQQPAVDHGKPKKDVDKARKEKRDAKRRDNPASNSGPVASQAQETHSRSKEKKTSKKAKKPLDGVVEREAKLTAPQPRTVPQQHQEQHHVDPQRARGDSRKKRAEKDLSGSQDTGAPNTPVGEEGKQSRRRKDKARAARADTAPLGNEGSPSAPVVAADQASTKASQRQRREKRKASSKDEGATALNNAATVAEVGVVDEPQGAAHNKRNKESKSSRRRERPDVVAPPHSAVVDGEAIASNNNNNNNNDRRRRGGRNQGDAAEETGPHSHNHSGGKSREEEILEAHANREQAKQRAKEKEVRARRQEQVVRDANEQLRRRQDPTTESRSPAAADLASVAQESPSAGGQQRNKFSVTSTTKRSNLSAGKQLHHDPGAAGAAAALHGDHAIPLPAPRRVVVMRRGGGGGSEAAAGSCSSPPQQPQQQSQ